MHAAGSGRARRGRGELENEVLTALWDAARPLTAREVHRELGEELAYNTVQTILARLHDKQLVQRFAHGRAHRYAPTSNPHELTARRMRDLLEAGTDRRSALQQFVGDLAPSDHTILRELLANWAPTVRDIASALSERPLRAG